MNANSQPPRWSGPIPVKQVVYEAVLDFTGGDADIEFAIRDIKPVALKKYPNFNVSNVDAEINADCVNSPSRHHFSGNEDRYWRVGHGIYRLYNPEKDNEERITSMKGNPQPPRRSGPIPVKQVVWEAVLDFTGGDADIEFAIKDIKPVALEKYPNFNVSNVSAEINADCVNSPSRHHYSGNEDRYWRVEHGIYRLYNPEKDKLEGDGERNQGEERITSMKGDPQPPRRSGPIPVKQVVWEAVLDFTGGDADIEFAIRDIKPVVLKKYPNFNVSNVDAEINADCVNSPSRHHYSGNEDRYWRVEHGIYRLYNPEKDKAEGNEKLSKRNLWQRIWHRIMTRI